jgi:hypothetical protein
LKHKVQFKTNSPNHPFLDAGGPLRTEQDGTAAPVSGQPRFLRLGVISGVVRVVF